MNRETLLTNIKTMNIWKKHDQRAPHKPLLILYALAQLQSNQKQWLDYRIVSEDLRRLLIDFGPYRKSYHPEQPFVRLANDGIWQLNINIKEIQEVNINDKWLKDKNILGGFNDDVYDLLIRDVPLIRDTVDLLLNEYFDVSMHNKIKDFLKLNIGERSYINSISKESDVNSNVNIHEVNSYKLNQNVVNLYALIKARTKEKSISIEELSKFVLHSKRYNVEFIKDLFVLKQNGMINWVNDEIYTIEKQKIYFKESLKNINDLDNKIIQLKLIKKTDIEIISDLRIDFNLELDSDYIRNTVNKFIYENADLFELDYKNIFTTFDWTEKVFCNCFDLDSISYKFLNLRYEKGTISIPDFLLKKNRSDESYQYSYEYSYEYKDIMIYSTFRDILILMIMDMSSKTVLISSIIETITKTVYHKNILINSVDEFLTKRIELILRTSKYIIPLNNNKYRFTNQKDGEKLVDTMLKVFKKYKGLFSFNYIYLNSQKIFKSVEILSDIELRFFFIKNKSKWVGKLDYKIIEDSMILIRYATESDYLDSIISKTSIDFSNYVDKTKKISYEYGLDTIYLTNRLYQHLKKVRKLEKKIPKFNDRDKKHFIRVLKKDFYKIDELEKIISLRNSKYTLEFINENSLRSIGFYLKDKLVIRNEIKDIRAYYEKVLKNMEFIVPDQIEFSLIEYPVKPVFEKLLRNYEVIKFNKSQYITMKKLKQFGITKQDIYNFQSELKNNVDYNEYFTISQFEKIIQTTKFSQIGFDIEFYESLLKYCSNISMTRINNNLFFCKSRIKKTAINFFESKLSKFESIDVDKLINLIELQHHVELEYDYVTSILQKTKFYYDNIMGKVYLNKHMMYREVYNNE